ncbi:MAG: DUF4886 domain-containing protein [Planctomycetota bacterium]
MAYGKYQEALPGFAWDAVALQLYRDGQTYAQDISAAAGMINLARTNSANNDTTFYLYQSWARRSTWDSWLDRDDLTTSDNVVNTREGAELMLAQVRQATGADVYIIPTGDVFYSLGVAINAGEIQGLTSHQQLYRDNQHASYDIGRYVAGLTVFASVYGTEGLSEIVPPDGFYRNTNAIWTPETISDINAVVASVINGHADVRTIPEPGVVFFLGTAWVLIGVRRVRV